MNKFFSYLFKLSKNKKLIFLLAFFIFGLGAGKDVSAATRTVCASGCDYVNILGAEAGAIDGDIINVSAGTYNEGNPTFAKALNWVAIDGIGTVIITNSVAGGNYAAAFNGVTATTITGFIFDALSNDKAMVLITGSNKTFIDCTFRNTLTGGYPGIQFTGTNDANTFIRPTVTTTGVDFVNQLFDMHAGITTNTTITYPTVSAVVYGYVIGCNMTDTGVLTIGNGSIGSGGIWNITTATGRAGSMRFLNSNLSGNVSVSNATINFIGSVGNAGIIATSADGTMGSFIWANNSVSSEAAGAQNLINISKTSHEISIMGGSINYPAGWGNWSAILISDQVAPIIDSIVLINGDTGTGGDTITVTATSTSRCGTSCGIAQVKNTTIYTKNTGAVHAIQVGFDSTGAGNNMLDGAIITGNKIYGPSYYDTSINSYDIHGILYGYNKNGLVNNNYVEGVGFGIIIKGAGDIYLGGGVFNNIVKNVLYAASIMVKGQKNVPIYNNVLYTDQAVNASYFGLMNIKNNADGLTYNATGNLVRNNLFFGIPNKDLIQFDTNATGFTATNNGYYMTTGLNPLWHIGSSGYSTFDGLGSWQSLGYDIYPSFFSDPLFINQSLNNFQLTYLSPAIDSGTSVGLTSDYAGNPIYGTPDIGAYEYQPPHLIGIDKIDIGAGARIYGDGRFRDKETTNSNLADLIITPESGNFNSYNVDEIRPEWLDIKNITWGGIKEWTESSIDSSLTNTLHTVGDLTPNNYYNVSVDNVLGNNITGDNCIAGVCKSSSEGKITFTYTGTYGEHTFKVEAGDNSNPTLTNNTNNKFNVKTTSVNLSLITDENSTCRYSNNSAATFDNATAFTTTGETSHLVELTNLTSGNYLYYAICRDSNSNESSYTLSFEIAPAELKEKVSSPIIKTSEGKEKMKSSSTLYSDEKEIKLQGEDLKLANGAVKIYQNSKKIKTIQADANGKWSGKVKLSSDFSGYLKVKLYNQYGTLINEKKTKVKVDNEKPEFTEFPKSMTIFKARSKISFQATDNKEVTNYKIYFDGKIIKTKNNSFSISDNANKGIQYLGIKAYDKAGNSVLKKIWVIVK